VCERESKFKNLIVISLQRLVDGIQENQPVLTITHAEHARLVAMVNEDQLGNSLTLKRKRNKIL
jgi:hypothetical protein